MAHLVDGREVQIGDLVIRRDGICGSNEAMKNRVYRVISFKDSDYYFDLETIRHEVKSHIGNVNTFLINQFEILTPLIPLEILFNGRLYALKEEKLRR
jgi:hypothetical protein